MSQTWNYRLLRHHDGGGEYYYAIHKVYYNHSEKPIAHSSEPAPMCAPLPGELYDDCILSLEAFVRPVLDAETYEEVKPQGLKNKQKGGKNG